ncbi:MAG: glycosyltransferase [Bryobacteraceae bacterium]|nr:glycosyltransferase [Bryobacteraceae bacterium]
MRQGQETGQGVAVLIPCYNEERTIRRVVEEFRATLPEAAVYVYDNNSSDRTWEEAEAGGAEVRREGHKGKGRVVRRMFAEIEADYYVLVDGDGTYDASAAPDLLALARQQCLAMVVARRIEDSVEAYRPGHVLGNKLFTKTVAALFGTAFTDILSGYRVFSRPFVKSFPVFTDGFEIETELTVHALTLALPVGQIDTVYRERAMGSQSKLRTYRDGLRILLMILILMKNEKPLAFFSALSLAFLLAALVMAYPIAVTYLRTGLVPRLPTATLATGLALSSQLMFTCGLILETVSKGRHEAKLLAYLSARDSHPQQRVSVKQ